MSQGMTMKKSWMGVLGATLGVAALPASAVAQAPASPITVTIASPAEGDVFTQGQQVPASYMCSDTVATVIVCQGPVPSTTPLDTSTLGQHAFTVVAVDSAPTPNFAFVTHNYTVVSATPTLSLTLGQGTSFSPFQVGVANTYTATQTATATSTYANASLSVVDPDTAAPGHLVNGGYALAQPLKVSATSSHGTPSAGDGSVSGTPAPLLGWTAPFDNDAITMTFSQTIGATEALRSGDYSKTLTFTLSTTTP